MTPAALAGLDLLCFLIGLAFAFRRARSARAARRGLPQRHGDGRLARPRLAPKERDV